MFWALFAAPFGYVGVLFLLPAIGLDPVFDDEDSMRYVVVAVLAVVSTVGLTAREYLTKRTVQQSRDRGESIWDALATGELMRMTINESVAIYGLVIYVLTMEPGLAVPFISVAAVALYLSRPRRDLWREAAKEERT